jgi:hypothetical protein
MNVEQFFVCTQREAFCKNGNALRALVESRL